MKGFRLHEKDMNLQQIAESGQIFRMKKYKDGYWVYKGKERVLVTEIEGDFLFHCSEEKFRSVWYEYFDLDTDYSYIKSLVDQEDSYLMNAIRFGSGIRILRQDIWEVIIGFLISQNNNIPRIKKSIEKLCFTTEDENFPTPEEMAKIPNETLRSFGLGYRDEYVKKMAEAVLSGELILSDLKRMDYEEAQKTLLKRHGIGKKVADCICVFGLHHLDAFPIDTHIKRILKEHYPDGFPFEKYHGYAAVMQQYMFFYEIAKKKIDPR